MSELVALYRTDVTVGGILTGAEAQTVPIRTKIRIQVLFSVEATVFTKTQ